MAGMSGWELGEKLKSVRPDQRVLLMSGYSDEVLADHGVVESWIPPGAEALPVPFGPERAPDARRAAPSLIRYEVLCLSTSASWR